MPSTNVQELEGWISNRNAVEFGDMSLVAKIGLLVGQGASQLGSIGSRSIAIEVFRVVFVDRRSGSQTPCIAASSVSGLQQ